MVAPGTVTPELQSSPTSLPAGATSPAGIVDTQEGDQRRAGDLRPISGV